MNRTRQHLWRLSLGHSFVLLVYLAFFMLVGPLICFVPLTAQAGAPVFLDDGKSATDRAAIRELDKSFPYNSVKSIDTIWRIDPQERRGQSIENKYGHYRNLTFGATLVKSSSLPAVSMQETNGALTVNRIRQLVWRALLGCIFLLFICITFFARSGPLYLLKPLTVKAGAPDFFDESKRTIDRAGIKDLVGGIPYQPYRPVEPVLDTVWHVKPRERYVQSIEKGYGHCSNLSFGAFYKLAPTYKVNIVHFNHPKEIFTGRSHTMLQAKVSGTAGEKVLLVDLLYAGVWSDGDGEAITAEEFVEDNRAVRFESHNVRKSDKWHIGFAYDSSKRLSGSVVGQVPQSEINKYFDFMDAVYVPFGNHRVEKIVYDFVAVLFNKYPNTYVSSYDYKRLFKGKYVIVITAYVTKLLFYVAATLSVIQLILWI